MSYSALISSAVFIAYGFGRAVLSSLLYKTDSNKSSNKTSDTQMAIISEIDVQSGPPKHPDQHLDSVSVFMANEIPSEISQDSVAKQQHPSRVGVINELTNPPEASDASISVEKLSPESENSNLDKSAGRRESVSEHKYPDPHGFQQPYAVHGCASENNPSSPDTTDKPQPSGVSKVSPSSATSKPSGNADSVSEHKYADPHGFQQAILTLGTSNQPEYQNTLELDQKLQDDRHPREPLKLPKSDSGPGAESARVDALPEENKPALDRLNILGGMNSSDEWICVCCGSCANGEFCGRKPS